MIVVAVIVYDRYKNIERWINAWKQCDTGDAQLVVVHNDNGEGKRFAELCERNNITYVQRGNKGFDIGAMQDVFKERLFGFPNDWDYLLWCTDDVLPMDKDFITPFLATLNNANTIVAAMHISVEVEPHVRTGCFMISKGTSKLIKFPADPVTTKKHCYDFEHRGGFGTLTNQIRMLGGDCRQIAPLDESPVYDTNYWRRNKKVFIHYQTHNREPEHNRIFKTNP